MQRDDYIERMIAQVAAAVGRILGIARVGQPEHAEQELAAAWTRLVGLRRADADRLDEATLLTLLGNKRVAAAMLLEAEAELKRAGAEAEAAARAASLAARLRR